MLEPAAATAVRTVVAFARLSCAVDALCSAIAGFALLAGTRAFAFTALLAWREPVLGGVGLVLLALVGWLRWRCGVSRGFARMDAKLLATIDRPNAIRGAVPFSSSAGRIGETRTRA
ncbi:hypothetical protein ACTJLC_21760 [Paraburkholderia sp. 22099]|jgi:hypothetical protein|uniref:hypothetical protein n=1 Tax=Paraburkholderia TaxID=1822464 RepID=UPI002863D260|nr:hypothetical protein [Paraburkholderia terricola]MDR6491369.1 hypothetical protein [Paraburkholderia terricola]